LILVLLSGLAFSIFLRELLQKINEILEEFIGNLYLFFMNPIIILFAIFICSSILVFRVTFKNRLNKKYEIEEIKQIEESKKPKINKFDYGLDEEAYEEKNLRGLLQTRKDEKCINIRVDEDKRYFHKKSISKDEVNYLLNKNYQIKKYKNLLNGRMENFVLNPRFNESFTHLFLVKNISEYLEKNGIDNEIYTTRKPDIIFKIGNKKYAIEVETGSIFSKIHRMKEKLEVLGNYDVWFFVVTDRNKVKKYKKYGSAVDKRYVKPRLDKLIKIAKKAQK
jgi:cell division protein FtsB